MQTQGNDEANCHFSQFPKSEEKKEPIALQSFLDYYLHSLKFRYKSHFKSRWNKRNQVKRIQNKLFPLLDPMARTVSKSVKPI
jgi:hypothetical protein